MSERVTIERLRIDGFGHFQALDVRPSSGLHLFHGANEAGKSTLLAFVRSVLFGFERRGDPRRYEPERGDFGGEVSLDTGRGQLHVWRGTGKRAPMAGERVVRTPDGDRVADEALTEALGGVSRELFCEVFAFSLEELSSFERLAQQRGVSEALLAAGMHGARRLPDALDTLRKETERLYSPNARGTQGKKELNRALIELAEVQDRLRQAGDRPALYFAAVAEREAAQVAAQRIASERARWDAERGTLRRQREAESWVREWRAVTSELETRPELASFPVDGLMRLDAALQRRESARAESASVAVAREAVAATLRGVPEAPDLREAGAAAEHFVAVRTQLRQLPARRAKHVERLSILRASASELGLEGPIEALASKVFPASRRAELVAAGEALRAAENGLSAAQTLVAETLEARREVEATLELLSAEGAPPEAEGAPSPTAALDALGRIPRAAEAHAKAMAALRNAQLTVAAFRPTAPPAPVVSRLPVRELWVWLALLGIAAGVGLWRAQGLANGLLVVVGAGVVAAMLVLKDRWREQLGADARARVDAEASAKEGERARLASLEESLRSVEQERRAEWERLHAEAGLSQSASELDRVARAGVLTTQLEQAAAQSDRLRRLEDARATHERIAARLASAHATLEEAEEVRGAQAAAWGALLREEGFPASLPTGEVVALWDRRVELRQRVREAQAEAEALRVEQEEVGRAVAALLEACTALGWEVTDAESAVARVEAARELAREAREERRRLAERETLLAAQAARWEREGAEAESELDALLTLTGCVDVEAFRRRARDAEAYSLAARRAAELAGQVRALTGETCEALADRIAALGGEEGLAARLREAEEAVARIDAELEQHHQTLGSLQTQLSAWAQDTELRALREREEALRVRVTELADRYAGDQLALVLLERAKEAHRLAHQPKLLQRASAHLWQLTRGRYSRVWVDPDAAGGLRVLDTREAKKREWEAESLSRGTREQLYLAFRLAVIEDLCEERPALPLVLDDILVNFDPDRAEAAVALLARVAERHQILALTCHPWIRDIFLAHGATVTEMGQRMADVAAEAVPEPRSEDGVQGVLA